jgi:phage baseplate assembly protein W
MAKTTSLAFPNMFNITNNQVSVLEDTASVGNRTRLLILTEPTELYNNPDFGVGLKRHLWKYNTDTERGLVKDKITEQLRLHEPCVYPEKTTYSDGLLFSGSPANNPALESNTLSLTVALQTVFKDTAQVTLNYDSANNEIYTKTSDEV